MPEFAGSFQLALVAFRLSIIPTSKAGVPRPCRLQRDRQYGRRENVTANQGLNGAVASTAGDDFHELWAVREVLRLLDPAGEYDEVKVEGVPEDDVHRTLGDHAQAVDVTLRRRAVDGREGARSAFHYAQLKYSSAAPGNAWTWERLLAPRSKRKPQSSVLGKLAGLLKATDFAGTFAIVTNQPLAAEVQADVGRLLCSGGEGAGDDDLTAVLARRLGLDVHKLSAFLAAWDLNGFGAVSRLTMETEVIRDLSAMLDADARSDAGLLQQRLSALILPENRNHAPINRETLLVWLGAGSGEALFPAPSRIVVPELARTVQRTVVGQVVEVLLAADKPVRIHAGGGCGKTSLLSMLAGELPAGSETFVYDCYGGGLFLASDQRRHRPEQAFTQMANELAARLRTPFVVRRESSRDALGNFQSRVAAAAGMVEAVNPGALLLICFDAVDNARIGARHWRESCFLDELVNASTWPGNVRIVLTCRTNRLDEVGPDHLHHDVRVLPFEVAEVEDMVERWQPGWDLRIASTLHDLTGGNPRRLVYALDGLPDDGQEAAIERLMPRAVGIDPLFEKLVDEAGVRLGDRNSVWRLLCALAHLPRPVPGWVLAAVAGMKAGDVEDVAADVGGIVEHAAGWSFQDEDFEHFVDERTTAIAPELIGRAADLLMERRCDAAYAATAVAEMLVAAGRTADLYALVQASGESMPGSSRIESQLLASRRLALALRCCREAADIGTACELMIASAEAASRDRLLEDLIASNLDLSVRFAPEPAMRLVLAGSRHRSKRARLRIEMAAAHAATEPAVARDHMRWWSEHLRDATGPHPHELDLSAGDPAAEYEANLALLDPSRALARLRQWRPTDRLFRAAKILAARGGGRDPKPFLDAMDHGPWTPAVSAMLIAAALLADAEPSDGRILREFQSLARAPRSRWPQTMSTDVGLSDPLDWQEATLTACELTFGDARLHPLISEVLDRAFALPDLAEARDLLRLRSTGAMYARMLAMQERLAGRSIVLEEWLPPWREVPRAGKRSTSAWSAPREKTPEERWNEALRETTDALDRLFQAARTTLAMSLDGTPVEDGWRDFRSALNRSAVHHRHPPEAASVHLLIRGWMVAAVRRGTDIEAFADRVDKLLDSWGIEETRRRIDLASALGHMPAGHDAALGILVRTAGRIGSHPARASERASELCACARVALPLDPALARSLFEDAVDATDGVDLEVMSELAACQAVAKAGLEGDRPGRVALAEMLADAAGAVEATLHMGGEFPWSKVAEAIAAADLTTGLAAAARWRDRGLVDYDLTLPAILTGPTRNGLTVAQRQALASLCGEERPTLAEIALSSEPLSDATVEAELRKWSNEGDRDRLRGVADFVGGTSAGRLDGVETANEMLRTIGSWHVAAGQSPAEDEDDADVAADGDGADTDDGGAGGLPRSVRSDAPGHAGEVGGDGGSGRTLASHEAIREAIEHAVDVDYVVSEYAIARVADRVRSRALRVPFLVEIGRISRGGVLKTLPGILERWRDYPPVADWARTELPRHIVASLVDLFGWQWDDVNALEALLAATGLPAAAQAAVLLDAVVGNADALRAEPIFEIVGVLAGRAEAGRRDGLLHDLLSRTRKRSGRGPKVPITGADAPVEVAEAVARLLFATMGDVDRSIRWRAAHSAMALILAEDPAALHLVECLDRDDEASFATGPFYVHAAREQLMAVLLRAALDRPDLIAPHAKLVLAHVRRHPHLTVRELGRELLTILADRDPSLLDDDERGEVQRANRTQLPRVPKGRRAVDRRAAIARARERPFDFDTVDTTRYWYNRPAAMFGMPMDEFLDHVEAWIHGRWGFGEGTTHWKLEPRLDRLEMDQSHVSHRQGVRPRLERLSTYLEWHGMMCAVGALVETRPFTDRGPHDDRFSEWMERHLPSLGSAWASDLRTPPPMAPRFWSQSYDGAFDHRRFDELAEDDFDQEIGLESVTVAGNYELVWKGRLQTVTIRSALATNETADALGRALLTARDHMDFILPGVDDDHDIEDEDGFRLVGWLASDESEARMDRDDERRGPTGQLPVRPAGEFGEALGLTHDVAKHAWLDEAGRVAIDLEVWGDREPKDFGGWRATATPDLIGKLVRTSGMSLVVTVEISRRPADDDQPSRTRWRVYIVDGEGGIRRVERQGRLGPVLVRREGLSSSCDTLGRWMLHRAAELHESGGRGGVTAAERLCDRIRRRSSLQSW